LLTVRQTDKLWQKHNLFGGGNHFTRTQSDRTTNWLRLQTM